MKTRLSGESDYFLAFLGKAGSERRVYQRSFADDNWLL